MRTFSLVYMGKYLFGVRNGRIAVCQYLGFLDDVIEYLYGQLVIDFLIEAAQYLCFQP